eukprot:TRINITY_DN1989_c0_g1_i1.p1 TRINITY_DN1989_c0_g1~~TRINITY_DN1989_c0_g1_i1.p1  ORF type:complete len:588 (+),score=184.71 TRINITY_DN1989_c0_g1_i1:40-1764(+)
MSWARLWLVCMVAATAGAIPTNMGLDHVGFTVRNVTEAKEFFMDLFDCVFDWEVKRGPQPNSGERGWDKLFGVHSESYMPDVLMLRCGEHHLAQYLELFEWVSPDQNPRDSWPKFSDIGHGYMSFTVKDVDKVMAHIKASKYYGVDNCRFLQDPAMEFPLRGELCKSTFLVSPFGLWIELTEWSESKKEGKVISWVADDTCVTSSAEAAVTTVEDIDTPFWGVDLDNVEHNIRVMKSRIPEGVAWRPPVKSHKSPEFAKFLVESGAEGVLTLKVSEAEMFALAGIQNIYIANCVVRPKMIQRMVAIAGKIEKLYIHVDSLQNAQDIDKYAGLAGLSLNAFVEVNIGHNRTGVDTPEEAVQIAKFLEGSKHLNFAGVTGYEGHTPVMEAEKKKEETGRAHGKLKAAKDAIEGEGITVGMVTAGGSCNYVDALQTGVLTEIQAGGGVFNDKLYNNSGGLGGHGHKVASYVFTTVVSSAPDGSRAMADAGFKSVGWHPFAGLPILLDNPHWEVAGLSAEHLKLKPTSPSSPPLPVGTLLKLVPGYTDAMGLLHRNLYGLRGNTIEKVFPITAAGRLQ